MTNFQRRLSSLLDSSAHETSHGVRYEMDWESCSVKGPLASSIRRFVQVVPTRRLAPETVDDLLRTTDHLISWSFFSTSGERAALEFSRGQSICAVDCQDAEASGRRQATISLNVSMLAPLLGTKLNATEKVSVQTSIGVNVCFPAPRSLNLTNNSTQMVLAYAVSTGLLYSYER